jgi:hypothetical protein
MKRVFSMALLLVGVCAVSHAAQKISRATTPFAVVETTPDRICLTSQRDLRVGQRVVIVLFDPQRFLSGHISGRAPSSCIATGDLAGTRFSVAPETTAELDFNVGIGITADKASAVLKRGTVELRNVVSPGDRVHVRRCAGTEGLHLTAWQGQRRVWHQYYYLGYDVDPTCTEAEYEPPN